MAPESTTSPPMIDVVAALPPVVVSIEMIGVAVLEVAIVHEYGVLSVMVEVDLFE